MEQLDCAAAELRQVDTPACAHLYRVDRLIARDVPTLLATAGRVVDTLYPSGRQKMAGRLDQAVNGYASAQVVRTSATSSPIALSSETGKGFGALKVCTFWVHPSYRRSGVGTLLLESRVEEWLRREVNSAHVTVRATEAESISALFRKVGFRESAIDPDRYGDGEDELILSWKPEYLLDVDPFIDLRTAQQR